MSKVTVVLPSVAGVAGLLSALSAVTTTARPAAWAVARTPATSSSVKGKAVGSTMACTASSRSPSTWCSVTQRVADAAGRRLFDALGISMLAPAVAWAYQHRLGDIPLDAPLPWAALFIGQELAYYWGHRLSHRVHWLWPATRCTTHPRSFH